MFFNAGDLRHKLKVLKYGEMVNEFGQIRFDKYEYRSVWCQVVPQRSYEKTLEEKLSNVITYKIIMRYNTWLKEDMTILYRDTELTIRQIVNVDGLDYALEVIATHEVIANAK